MYKVEKYLENTFGIKTRLLPLGNEDKNKLPVYFRSYDIKTMKIFEQKILIIKMDFYTEGKIERLRKQAKVAEDILDIPVVFLFEKIEAYNRKRMIHKKIPFIVTDKQIFLPFLFIQLQENKDGETKQKEKLSPAAQCLFLYYLLRDKLTGLNFKALAKKLNYGQMTITRAANTLNNLNLCKIEGHKNKTIVLDKNRKELWQEALKYLINPVEKEIYDSVKEYYKDFYISGINALANYTNIAGENKKTIAVYKQKKKNLINNIDNSDEDNFKDIIQLWKYDPGILTENKYVDPLSLYLTLRDTDDERIEKELKKLIDELWLTD